MHRILSKIISDITSSMYLSGLLLGTVGGYVLFLLIHPQGDQTWINAIEEWQTLVSALLALAAAWWTVKTIEKQIWDERERHSEIRTRKALSMRAHMPDALIALTNFTRRCFNYIQNANEDFPEFCPEAIQIFKESIEFLDTQSSGMVYEMVSFYQVHNSRLTGYRDRGRPASDYEDRILDIVRLNYLALRIFAYARNLEQSIPNHAPTRDDLTHSLRSIIGTEEYMMNEERYENLRVIVERRYADYQALNPPA